MRRVLALSLLISSSAIAQTYSSGAQRVQGVRTGYGDPVQVIIVGGDTGSSTSGLTDIQLRASPIPVSGSFYPSTQPVSLASPINVLGPLTNTELRATPLPISGTVNVGTVPVTGSFYQVTQPISGTVSINGTLPVSGTFWPSTQPVSGTFWQTTQPVSIAAMPSTPVTGAFWQATQPISGTVTANVNGTVPVSGPLTDTQLRASALPVSGAFFQSTQPVSIATTVGVSGPLTDTQLRATAVPVSGTFFQSTQPVSGTVTITPATLVKGTQGATGISTQDLKDAGRTTLAMTSELTFAQTAETLLTLTLSANAAAVSTFTSRVITSGKRFRLQSMIVQVETLGSGTAPQRAYLRFRANLAGATTTSSPLQSILPCGVTTAIVKASAMCSASFPDGMELSGDGTATFGFSLETPDFITTTATGRAKITILAYEY